MWVEAGQPAHTFWDQTQRSFANTLEGAAKRDIAMAWKIAALTASASVGKLPTLSELLEPKPSDDTLTSHDAKLLHFFMKLKSRNVPVDIKRLH